MPKKIPHPAWAVDGNPRYSFAKRNHIPILDAKGQDAMRKSCRLAREVLDVTAAAIKPGITTDQLDEICHNACVERNVCTPSMLMMATNISFLVVSVTSQL